MRLGMNHLMVLVALLSTSLYGIKTAEGTDVVPCGDGGASDASSVSTDGSPLSIDGKRRVEQPCAASEAIESTPLMSKAEYCEALQEARARLIGCCDDLCALEVVGCALDAAHLQEVHWPAGEKKISSDNVRAFKVLNTKVRALHGVYGQMMELIMLLRCSTTIVVRPRIYEVVLMHRVADVDALPTLVPKDSGMYEAFCVRLREIQRLLNVFSQIYEEARQILLALEPVLVSVGLFSKSAA